LKASDALKRAVARDYRSQKPRNYDEGWKENARDLIELDLEEFLKALKEDYKLNESQLAKAEQFWRQNHGA